MLSLKWISFFMFMSAVVAYPFKVDQIYERSPLPAAPNAQDGADTTSGDQAAMKLSASNETTGFRTLQQLYNGNQKFRQGVRMSSKRTTEEVPGFMFLGCLDNRLTPSTIFNAPSGSIVSHNNIGNQYSNRDAGADAAVAYAVESLQVQHIIVLGHYGCKGVQNAIANPPKLNKLVRTWIAPIKDLYAHARRLEVVNLRNSRMPRRGLPNGITDAPPAGDSGFRALVEENVKRSVKNLRQNYTLQQALSRKLQSGDGKEIDVFVHGFVYDEGTGEVHDLHVSYGPPGKTIPHIPFQAIKAAKNYHSSGGGIKKGKTWDFKAHHM